jgi:serralysin
VNVNLNTGAPSGGPAAGDQIWGFEGVRGSLHDDTLRASASGSVLDGGAGSDQLFGSSGPDTLTGGTGDDRLSGGGGADRFVFNSASDSPWSATGDRIQDFQPGIDKIDLSGADANAQAGGNQAFTKLITSGQP